MHSNLLRPRNQARKAPPDTKTPPATLLGDGLQGSLDSRRVIGPFPFGAALLICGAPDVERARRERLRNVKPQV